MDQITGMEQIQHRQEQICEFLIRMMPVEWNRIYFYAQVAKDGLSVWFAVEEKETGAVCTVFDFFKRYDSYPISKEVAGNDLPIYGSLLYNAYKDRFGKEKVWTKFYLTLNEDYTFHADLDYDIPPENIIESFKAVYRHFFGREHISLTRKYPY